MSDKSAQRMAYLSQLVDVLIVIVALHHTKRTYMCTCITLSTLYGLQTLEPIEVH